jgi:hypothetical protein
VRALALCTCFIPVSANCDLGREDLEFAFKDGTLYASLNRQFEDRGHHVLYMLMQVAALNPPDVFATMSTLASDHPSAGATFAFWRRPGHTTPLVWPDWDFTGWAFAWIPPDNAVFEIFAGVPLGASGWKGRHNEIYWTGALLNKVRAAYAKCAEEKPAQIKLGAIDWRKLRKRIRAPIFTGAVKPIRVDLRELLKHTHLAYLPGQSWSTSLKRIASAEAAVILPAESQEESFNTIALSTCTDCFYYFDENDMWGSLEAALSNSTLSLQKAERLRQHASSELTLDKALHSALQQVRLAALSTPVLPPHTMLVGPNSTAMLIDDGPRLEKVTCKAVKKTHKARLRDLAWQVDEWLDDRCAARRVIPYLQYSAL